MITSFILCLPITILFSLIALNIEPDFGPLEPLFNTPDDQPQVIGSLILLGAFLLLPVAFFIARAPIVRTMRAGGSLFAHPIHLALAVAILLLIAWVVGSIIVDQYPCWIGVPNCD
ncbi:MAG: hypothetical protein DWI57_10680 [Chloroflexi bacterium]|nr:MAG: hypothetical protein DWI57_10680 [Chloroflexota bacterium]